MFVYTKKPIAEKGINLESTWHEPISSIEAVLLTQTPEY